MFEGILPEQFHQFISSLPLSFSPPIFDSPEFHFQQQLQLHQHYPSVLQQEEKEEQAKIKDTLHSTEAAAAAASDHQHHLPWSKDELLSLLRIRSSMDTNWFPDFSNWDHVSRKLGELGIERSGEKCREKFEEETTHLMSCNTNTNNLNELQKLCGSVNPDPNASANEHDHQLLDHKTRHEKEEEVEKTKHPKKRKRDGDDEHYYHQKLEMLKSFCEEVVNKMLSLQEDLHEKILQEMVKRDNEKIVREETWKKQDMERFEKDFQFRANQQALAGDRHTKLIHFLNNFTTTTNANTTPQNPNLLIVRASDQEQNPNANPSAMANQNPLPTSSSSTEGLPSSKNLVKQKPQKPKGRDGDLENIGKRWPKDQVLALINLRCSIVMSGSNTAADDEQEKELLGSKAPLWERISRGMLEMGYKRSAKRCKEKWENINKYFRKTKDNNHNRKRSLDSRTCPYFHQLNTLYNQGKLGMPLVEDTLLPPESQSSGNRDTIPAQPSVDENSDICC